MSPHRKGWDWWSEAKLKVLQDYLGAFTTAVRGRSRGAICLDLFAGSYENDRRHRSGTFPGSSQLALATRPEFTRLAFFELAGPAARLREDIEASRPGDRRWRVFQGDCNDTLPEALAWLAPHQWAPTFAFLDPRGLQVAWSTVETLARWRSDRRTKVEQWILMEVDPGVVEVQWRSSASVVP
jgi:three-Cys-motif partner protein